MNKEATIFSFSGVDLKVLNLPSENAKQKPVLVPLKSFPLKQKKVMNFRNLNLLTTGDIYQDPEYNLYEVSAAEDADGIIRRSIQKKRALGDKEGWTLKGKNNKTIEYIKNRLLQISLASGTPFNLLMKDTFGDLVRYHNAFWLLARNDKNSGGRKRTVRTHGGEKELNPISGVFRIAPETVRIKVDKYGNPKKYMQMMPDGRTEEYHADNIIHFVFNRRAGFLFAAPGMFPAIDDIRALRQIEENVELLIEQYLFPLFVVYIGSDEYPAEVYEDGTTEIDLWASKVDEMPSSGGMAVSHRHKFDSLGYDKVLPVEKYLEHFKKRAYTSAGVSGIDMGEGDGMNRSTADNASKILIEDVKDYQREFEYQVNFEFLYQLLLEKYQENVLMDRNVVNIEYNEIDIENMMKLENHYWLGYSMHGITEDEMRMDTNRELISDEQRSNMYLELVEKRKLEMEAKFAPAPATGSSSSKSQNTAKNKQQPSNQHGKSLGPTKKTSSLYEDLDKVSAYLDNFDRKDPHLTKIQLKNLLFTIDLLDTTSHNCNNIFKYVDEIIDSAYEDVDNNSISPQLAKDIIIKKLVNFL